MDVSAVLCLLLIWAHNAITETLTNYYTSMNVSVNTAVLETVGGVQSKIRCAGWCTTTAECNAVDFNSATGDCRLITTDSSSRDQPKPETREYMVKDETGIM